jgi:hypothetical protein
VGPDRTWFKFGSAGLYYLYRIRAYNSSGNSAYSNVACSGCMYLDSAPEPAFSDDFNDNSLDQSKWAINNLGTPNVSEQNQQLQITLVPNTAGYNGIDSISTFDFTGRMVQVDTVPVSQAGWCENFIKVWLDNNNYFLIDAGAGSMVFRSMVAGVNNQTAINIDAYQNHWWRIRHDPVANAVNFETSMDSSCGPCGRLRPSDFR